MPQAAAKTDTRLTRAERLEEQARGLRQAAEADFVASFPRPGERLLIRHRPFGMMYLEKEATVRHAYAQQRELVVDFDEYEICDGCGRRNGHKWTRIGYDNVITRHLPKPRRTT